MSSHTEYADTLRAHGFRATQGRIVLLARLARAHTPLSIRAIAKGWKDAPDQATLYRTLTDLAEAGVVVRDDLGTGVAHFEYVADRPHHHHAVCTACGIVRDVPTCPTPSTPTVPGFAAIASHHLSFFGTCNRCAH